MDHAFELADLAAEGQRVADQLASSGLESRPRSQGRDSKGIVDLELEGMEVRIVVHDGWERAVPALELDHAVSEALTAALEARYATEGAASTELVVEHATQVPSVIDSRTLATAPGFLAAIRSDGFAERLDTLLDRTAEEIARRLTARGPLGLATVRLGVDGAVQSVTFDADVISGKSGKTLTADASSAIERARSSFGVDGLAIGTATVMEVLSR